MRNQLPSQIRSDTRLPASRWAVPTWSCRYSPARASRWCSVIPVARSCRCTTRSSVTTPNIRAPMAANRCRW